MVAKKALSEMVSQTGSPQLDENGVMKKGVIVRHLLLPGFLEESKQVLKYLKTEFGEKIIISIMSQFTPTDNLKNYPEINRKVTKYEYDKLVEYAESIGIEKAYIQQGSAASESFIPDFDCSGI
jgi:putative pyruvate formate lyase activating enzyme